MVFLNIFKSKLGFWWEIIKEAQYIFSHHVHFLWQATQVFNMAILFVM
jgi:hypothetical protein